MDIGILEVARAWPLRKSVYSIGAMSFGFTIYIFLESLLRMDVGVYIAIRLFPLLKSL